MTPPTEEAIFATVEATWPARRIIDVPGWIIREGLGGGSRVSAATATSSTPDITVMEAAQRTLGQAPLVMVRQGETRLDQQLEAAGYAVKDPVSVYCCPVEDLAEAPPPVSAFHVTWPAMHIQEEIWEAGGIGPARLAVMDRAADPKCTILGRSDDHPAGTAFVASHGDIAMLHALDVLQALRRRGTGRNIMHGAALWAQSVGAAWLAVLVTRANAEANPLYSSLGMQIVGGYHYRSK